MAEHQNKRDRGDQYLSVDEACEQFGLSRSTFYRRLRDPRSGLVEVVVRVPATRRTLVPACRFEQWLLGAQ